MPLTLVSDTAALIPLLVKLFEQQPHPSAAWLEELETLDDPRQIADIQAKLATLGRPDVAAGLADRLRAVSRRDADDTAGLPVLTGTDRMLECDLTEAEVNASAQAALLLYQQADQDEEAEKQRAKEEKARIKDIRDGANTERRKSLTRKENRLTPCESRYVESSREVVIIRLDTGAVVERRSAKADEIAAYEAGRQARLF